LLHPDSGLKIEVHGFHTAFRVSSTGQLLTEVVAQFAQADHSGNDGRGGIPLRGGTTVVASADGTVRYLIAKPLLSPNLPEAWKRSAELRIQRQQVYLTLFDLGDPMMSHLSSADLAKRMLRRGNFSALHFG
jgi:hypothetical protein